jgi:hypothetical protein
VGGDLGRKGLKKCIVEVFVIWNGMEWNGMEWNGISE